MKYDIESKTTCDNAIRWNINQLEERLDTARIYEQNLEKIFYKIFNTTYCQLNKEQQDNQINITVTLHLEELTQTDIQTLNEIASVYTIEPFNTDEFILMILQFKGVE